MKYIVKYKDFIDLDDDAMLVDADETSIYGDVIVFSVREIPILYVPLNSIMFVKAVEDDLTYKEYSHNPDGLLN